MDFEEKFAKAILEAQDIREESFDHKAADRAIKEEEATDYGRFYQKSYYEAADDAAKNAGFDLRMTQPIYLLIKYLWNDIQVWAKGITK